MLTPPCSAYKKHENTLLGVFTVAVHGGFLFFGGRWLLKEYAGLGEEPGATTVSPGPTIQGFDASTITIIDMFISMPLKSSNTDNLAASARGLARQAHLRGEEGGGGEGRWPWGGGLMALHPLFIGYASSPSPLHDIFILAEFDK